MNLISRITKNKISLYLLLLIVLFILIFLPESEATYGETSLIAGVGNYWDDENVIPNATFNRPIDIVVDKDGNLYIVEFFNRVISV